MYTYTRKTYYNMLYSLQCVLYGRIGPHTHHGDTSHHDEASDLQLRGLWIVQVAKKTKQWERDSCIASMGIRTNELWMKEWIISSVTVAHILSLHPGVRLRQPAHPGSVLLSREPHVFKLERAVCCLRTETKYKAWSLVLWVCGVSCCCGSGCGRLPLGTRPLPHAALWSAARQPGPLGSPLFGSIYIYIYKERRREMLFEFSVYCKFCVFYQN